MKVMKYKKNGMTVFKPVGVKFNPARIWECRFNLWKNAVIVDLTK